MDIPLDKNTKETTHWVMKATAMTFHPVGPSEKDGNILTTKVMTKVMPTKGMRSISIRKVLRNVMALNILMRGFLAFIQVTTKVMKKSNAYEVNKKFTNQKSSEKGYTPKCGDKLPAVHPVNEKSPAHHQVNENSPAVHHDIQSRLTCDDYHSRDQAVYTTSSPKHEAIFPCVFCDEEFNDHTDLKKHLEHLHSKVPEIQVIQLKQQHNASDVTPGNEERSKSHSKTNKNNHDHSNEKSVSMETTQEESQDHIDSSKSNITVFSSDTSEVPKIKLSVNKKGFKHLQKAH